MKIRFTRRISGLAKVAYAVTEEDVQSYLVLLPGDRYVGSDQQQRKASCYALQVFPSGGIYQLKPGSLVREL